MGSKPILYSYFRSTCSWRVRIALAMKNIDYEYRAVHLLQDGGQQYKEEYKKINPNCLIPSLIIDGITIADSINIIEYLDETRDSPPHLIPRDPVTKTVVRQISAAIASGIQPIQNLRVLNHVGAGKKEWAKYWIEQGFNSLEILLEKTSGKYCVGDNITMADICLIPQVYNANRFQIDMTNYPVISRINAELQNHEAFQAAHPTQQPDCPEELKTS